MLICFQAGHSKAMARRNILQKRVLCHGFNMVRAALWNRGCYSCFWLISAIHKSYTKLGVLAKYSKAI